MADPVADIDRYLKSKGSPLAGLGNVFVAAGKKYGVDPRLTVAISGAESSFGKYLYGKHNAWGWGPGIPFGSWEEAIATVTRGLRSGYINEGLKTPAEMARKWAPVGASNDPTGLNHNWPNTVSTFLKELGGNPGKLTTTRSSAGTTLPAIKPPTTTATTTGSTEPPNLDLTIASGLRSSDPTGALRRLVDELASYQAPPPPTTAPASTTPSPPSENPAVPPTPAPPGNWKKWVRAAPGADRAGVQTNQSVFNAVARIAATFGQPLTISTGTNHNQYVSDRPGVESQHWKGNAADIVFGHGTGSDNVDPALTRLGRAALVAAGMPPAQAAKQTGGVFNLGGLQILFNTYTGGNHYNHLHVGVR